MASNDKNMVCCGLPMSRIYYAENGLMRGFYCSVCHEFSPAIGRERKLSMGSTLELIVDDK